MSATLEALLGFIKSSLFNLVANESLSIDLFFEDLYLTSSAGSLLHGD
jgi:hypothetical protein